MYWSLPAAAALALASCVLAAPLHTTYSLPAPVQFFQTNNNLDKRQVETDIVFVTVTATPTPTPAAQVHEVIVTVTLGASSAHSSFASFASSAPFSSASYLATPTPVAEVVTTTTPAAAAPTTASPSPETTSAAAAPTTAAADPTTSSSSDPAPTATAPSSDAQEALDAHNQYRALHSAPALSWSDDLASYAASHAAGCVFQHTGGPYGENLAAGYDSITDAVAAWYAEGDGYDYSSGSYDHFTQVIWIGSTQLGCATVSCDGSNGTPGTYLMCEYNPAGNVEGEFSQNVLPS